MKYKVTYYDYDSDSYLEKDLYWMASYRGTFDFVPVSDGPKENWKNFHIDGSGVNVFYNDEGMNITVDGFQLTKTGGYCKTTTFIKSVS